MKETFSNRITDIPLDKLTMVGVINADIEYFTNFMSTRIYVQQRRGSKSFQYSSSYVLVRGLGHIEFDNRTKAIRYEFNPNNFKEKQYEDLIPYHEEILSFIKNIHFTRVDIAIDFLMNDMSSFTFSNTRKPKTVTIANGNGVMETTYFGMKSSDVFYRLYNKAVETQDKDKATKFADGSWRLEIQITTERMVNDFLTGNFVPFMDMVIEESGQIPNEYKQQIAKVMDYFFLVCVLNEPTMYEELSSRQRTKFNELKKGLIEYKKTQGTACNIGEVVHEEVKTIAKELDRMVIEYMTVKPLNYFEEEVTHAF